MARLAAACAQPAARQPALLALQRPPVPAGGAAVAAAPLAAPLRPPPRRRQLQRCRVGPDPYSIPSPLFESEIFQKEMMELAQQLTTIQSMISRFADFDLEGKKIFLEQMEQLGEKLQVTMTRLQLADDPLGNEMLRMQRVQMLEAGTNLAATLQGFQAEIGAMREMVRLEESCADPATLEAVKRTYRDKFSYASRFNPMEIFNDPTYMEGALDPEAMKAMSEVAEDPSRLENWRHKPALYALLKKVTGL